MPALHFERGFSASSLFVWLSASLFAWLFALALSTRVVYPEPVQMTFFALTLITAWMSPSLRASVLPSMRRFFARSEGKVTLLLLLSSTITTVLSSMRYGMSLWLDWLLIVLFACGLFGFTAPLGQPLDMLRRIFRLVATLFGISVVSLLLITLYKGGFVQFFSWLPLIHVTAHFHTYWDGSYSGIVVLFVPLLLAAFSKAGIGGLAHARYRLFWRYWVLTILLFFLCSAFISERRVVGATLLVSLVVLSVAALLRYTNKRLCVLLGVAALAAGLALFAYLYHHPRPYPMLLSDCLQCNKIYLPLWLVDAPRQVAWHEMLVLWQQHPWFGIGIHNETTVLTHPHSRFLQILGDLGAVGFCLFLALLSVSVFKSLRAWKTEGSLKGLSLLLVHSVYWTGGLFDLSIWAVWHFCMYACAIVLSLSLDRFALDRFAEEREQRA